MLQPMPLEHGLLFDPEATHFQDALTGCENIDTND